MGRRVITIAATALCALLAITAVAVAATKNSRAGGIRFDQQDGSTVALGNVESPAAKCEARRRVILVARTTDGERVRLGTDVTSDNGGWFITADLPADLDETNIEVPPKKVSKQLRCGPASGGIRPVDQNPND